MSKPNIPEAEPEYDYGVAAPPFFIRKRKDKTAPEVLVQRGANAPKTNQGDAIINAMAQRIQILRAVQTPSPIPNPSK
jgi:hypothetical protein